MMTASVRASTVAPTTAKEAHTIASRREARSVPRSALMMSVRAAFAVWKRSKSCWPWANSAADTSVFDRVARAYCHHAEIAARWACSAS